VVLLGLGVSAAVWGPSVFRPIIFAAQRDSHYLSIFRFLRGRYSPLYRLGITPNVDHLAGPILLLALLRAWSWSRVRNIDTASSSVLAILTMLLFYQVGFPQYQMVLFVLASYWIFRKPGQIRNRGPLLVALACYFGWLAIFDLIECTLGADFHSMQEWAGLPTFLLGCALVVCVVRSSATQSSPDQLET
jgi:hypothetical protein